MLRRISSRRRRLALLAAIVLAAAARDAAAQGQPFFDHLKCHRIGVAARDVQVDGHALDPLTLTPFQVPPFEVEEGCRLQPARNPRPTHVCVPVDKQPRSGPLGSPLASDYLLYRLRCTGDADFEAGFVDQFVRGTVTVRGKTSTRLLLVPAYASQTPSSPCEPTAPGQCGGSCPNFDELCQLEPDGSCACVEQPPCGGDPVGGQCNGACEPGASCLTDQLGRCACLR
ncbi:MAG: hypothetical protein AB1689_27635 [Thermodesulfobacteriota bacterium]